MKENPYRRLPPLERKPDGTPYCMTPAQRKQANALIRRECCCYEGGDCIALDDGDAHTCPQTISFSVCCKWFRWAVLPQAGTLEAEIFRGKNLKRCEVCGGMFVPPMICPLICIFSSRSDIAVISLLFLLPLFVPGKNHLLYSMLKKYGQAFPHSVY